MRRLSCYLTLCVLGCHGGEPVDPTDADTDSDTDSDTDTDPVPVDGDDDGATAEVDCDDSDPEVGVGEPQDLYADGDGDGIGAGAAKFRCPEAGWVSTGGDCDDADAAIGVGVPEDLYRDLDGDGIGAGQMIPICPQPGWVVSGDDCDDFDADIGVGVRASLYVDNDGDGFGAGGASMQCPQPGYTAIDGDCDDTVALTYPGAAETWCDDIDSNCDAQLEDAARIDGVLYPFVDDAVAAALDFATVEICDGESFDVTLTRPMTFVGVRPGPNPRSYLQGMSFEPQAGALIVVENLLVLGTFQLDLVDGAREGGVYVGGAGDVLLDNCVLDALVPVDRGCALAHEGTGILTLLDTGVTGDSAIELGGAIYATGPLVLSGTTTVSGGDAPVGGGIWSSSSVTLQDDVGVSGNVATGAGGGIWSSGGVVLSGNARIEGNLADEGGGMWSSGTVTATAGSVVGNGATAGGGGVWFAGSTADVGPLFIDANSSLDGGGAMLEGAGSWTGGTFTNNVATSGGGGMEASGTWTVSDAAFSTNTALEGGAIYADAVDLTLTNVTSDADTASSLLGGALFGVGSTLVADGVTLTGVGLFASEAIHIGTSTLTLNNSTIANYFYGIKMIVEPFSLASNASTWGATGNDVAAVPDLSAFFTYDSTDGTFTCDATGCLE